MLEGYRGRALQLLSSLGIEVGDTVQVYNEKVNVKGLLMPSYSKDDSIIVLKLDNGYNAGFSIEKYKVELIGKSGKTSEALGKQSSSPGKIKIISTGGTIVSKVEYETGAVRPALSTEEIVRFLPEIQEISSISAQVLFSILSENMKPEYWVKIAEPSLRPLMKEVKE